MPLIVFSHANSFPASTYKVLFKSLRGRGYTVKAIEKVGHDPKYPVSNNWSRLAEQLADFARAEVAAAGEPAFFVGHSLGGYLSVIAAARHPALARGVLMLDSPLLGGWRATTLGVLKHTPLVSQVSPGKVSQRRRYRWPSKAAALAHFASKPVFARWDPRVLQDYIDHGLHSQPGHAAVPGEDGPCELSFDRAVETAIYNTLPHNLGSLLKRHPLACPAAFIGGNDSDEIRQVGLTLTRKVTHGHISMVEGGHLFPMEHPLATAAAIDTALRSMAG